MLPQTVLPVQLSPGWTKGVVWDAEEAVLCVCSLSCESGAELSDLPASFHPTYAASWHWHHSTVAIPCHNAPGVLLVDTRLYSYYQLDLGPQDVSRVLGWSAAGLLQIMQESPMLWCPPRLSLYDKQGKLSGSVALPVFSADHEELQVAGNLPCWAPDGTYFVLCGQASSNCFWTYDLLHNQMSSPINAGSRSDRWHSPAWEPSSDRLLLCSRGGKMLIYSRAGRRTTFYYPPFPALHSADWSKSGIALLTDDCLCLCTFTPSPDKMQVLHTLSLGPIASVHRVSHGLLATSWDGRHVAALVVSAEQDSYEVSLCDWESGDGYAFSRPSSGSETAGADFRWAPDGSSIQWSDKGATTVVSLI